MTMGVPVADCNLVLVKVGKVQHGWLVVVDWARSEYVGGTGKAEICCIADVDYVLSPLGGLAAGLPSGVVFVHVACN